MAHFAELDENNIVKQVIVVANSDILDENGHESEEVGINFLEDLFGHRNWKQSSYNDNFRFRHAAIGYKYHETEDGFSPPQPYPSWSLNKETLDWDPPVPKPNQVEGKFYNFIWDEDNQVWISEEIILPTPEELQPVPQEYQQ